MRNLLPFEKNEGNPCIPTRIHRSIAGICEDLILKHVECSFSNFNFFMSSKTHNVDNHKWKVVWIHRKSTHNMFNLGIMTHTCDPSTREIEAEEFVSLRTA